MKPFTSVAFLLLSPCVFSSVLLADTPEKDKSQTAPHWVARSMENQTGLQPDLPNSAYSNTFLKSSIIPKTTKRPNANGESEDAKGMKGDTFSKKESIQNEPAKLLPRLQYSPATADHLFWVYDASIELLQDSDRDGYYHSLRVQFDVDTILSQADVYARIYLGDADSWREIHTTSVFPIHSDASYDEFVMTTDLLQGFPSDDYDLLVEIYDADDHSLQDSYDDSDDPDLTLLSLESLEYEQNHYAPVPDAHSHGGSLGVFALLSLFGFTLFRRRA